MKRAQKHKRAGSIIDSPRPATRVSDAMAIQELISLPEKLLQSEIIEPLLRRMQFNSVQDNSGPRELGKDLVATKSDEFGQNMLYAIQIKKFKPSAKVGTANSFGRLLDQLRQLTEETVIDPTTNRKRRPDWCVFITPYPIPLTVKDSFYERLNDPHFKNLRIMDGTVLIEQIQRFMPEAFVQFSMETQYRLSLEQHIGSVHEAAVAFEINEELRLDDIYVDASLAQADSDLGRFAGLKSRRRRNEPVSLSLSELETFYSMYETWRKHSPSRRFPIRERPLAVSDQGSAGFDPRFARSREVQHNSQDAY